MDFKSKVLMLLLLLRRRRRRRRLENIKKKRKMLLELKLQNKKEKKKEINRKIWVKLILLNENEGSYYTLYPKLREDEKAFFEYFHMSIAAYDELTALLKESVSRKDTTMRKSIPAEERIAITLRYLASGCSFEDLFLSFRRGVSTISGIVKEVCLAIWNILKDKYLMDARDKKWDEIADGFKWRTQFPNCLGAIDGKHIPIKRAEKNKIVINCKQSHSIYLLAMCDSNYKFTFVDVEGNNLAEGQDIIPFEESKLRQHLENNIVNIRKPNSIITDGDAISYVIVGDEAFPLSPNLMKPYIGSTLTEKKKIFNYRLRRAQRSIECAFAILTSKWQVFHKPLTVSADFCRDIIKACCILHNFVLEKDELNYEDTLFIYGMEDDERIYPEKDESTADNVRDEFANYFVSDEGKLSWQSNFL